MALMSMLAPMAAESAGAGMFGSLTGADWLSAGSGVLGKSMQSGPGGAARSDSALTNTQSWDNSGWTVSTGSSKASAARGLDLPPWLLLGVAVLGVVAWVRQKKH